ncbi:hypothetical protein V502_10246 [Pseudogymnoascus sp. VKM F-4520 (FW-2644)]|nr:hypothetical protein V502_10246 [Pseudogymnoascus sp. VKM F-4520 (FW-2644)]
MPLISPSQLRQADARVLSLGQPTRLIAPSPTGPSRRRTADPRCTPDLSPRCQGSGTKEGTKEGRDAAGLCGRVLPTRSAMLLTTGAGAGGEEGWAAANQLGAVNVTCGAPWPSRPFYVFVRSWWFWWRTEDALGRNESRAAAMQHSSAEVIEGVERAGHAPGTTATAADAARLRNSGGSVRAHPVDDGMYPTENKVSTDRDSLRKVDLESNDTEEVKVHETEELRNEDEEPGTIKKFIEKYRKEIRIAIHVLIGVVMTG